MGNTSSAPPSYVTYAANEPNVEVTPYTIRRHPNFANGVLQLPEDMPSGQALYLKSIEKFSDREYVGSRKVVNGKRDKHFTFIKYKEAFAISKAFGAGLVKNGVQNKTFVCIFSENRPEWILTMDASYLYGFVTVALYDTFTKDALEFSITNCKSEYIVCSYKNLKRLITCEDDVLKQFKLVAFFDEINDEVAGYRDKLKSLGVNFKTFDELRKEGEGLDMEYPTIDPEQLLYICYSSGTTGFPKGVMISHRSFITNLIAISSEGTPKTFMRHLCYLPLCHVFERMCTSCALLNGGKIGTFSGDVRILSEDLCSLSPTVMIVVPRVVHRMYDAVMNGINKKGFVAKAMFNVFWYLKRYLIINEMGHGILDKILFNKIKALMGSTDIEQIVNGGAALPADLHEKMQVLLGIPIRTGYGLSEGGSGNTLNPFKIQHIKYGTNGYPLSNVEIRIQPVPEFTDPGVGEIQMGGTCLCSGYLFDEQATKDLFTDDTHTWIHTGDIGKFDEQNSLLVVDRMRSIFKLSQGEYVAGDLLATYFETSPLIEHIFVYGDSTKPYLVGIVIPAIPELARFLNKERLSPEEIDQACENADLKAEIMKQIKEISDEKKLLGYQRINSICIKNDEWTIDNGILSPTFKPKRKVLSERYRKEIDALYSQKK